jgi:stage IV sporulation protein FB
MIVLRLTRPRMIRFSLFGIPVEIQPFFWISLALLGGALGADSYKDVFRVLLFVLAGFISILVHELGHALTARYFKAQPHIVLQAFGGYAAYSGVRMTRTRSFLVTAAGPAIQIALGAVVYGLLTFIPPLPGDAASFLGMLLLISWFWAVLNLLPVIPLDGGQMLNAALGPARIRVTLWTSIITAGAVAAVMLVLDPGNFIFPIFMGMFGWQAWQALQQIKLR